MDVSRTHDVSAARPAVGPTLRRVTSILGDASVRPKGAHWLLVAFLVLHVVLVFGTAGREDLLLSGFVPLSFRDSGRALSGALPYRDFLLEYPPGTLLFMIFPRVFADGYLSYYVLFAIEIAILDATVLIALYASALASRVSVLRVLVLYTVALVLLGRVVVYRLDLAPVALTALGLLAWQRRKPAWAAAAFAAGTATKLYPAVLLPPLLIDQWYFGQRGKISRTVLVYAATLVLCSGPLLPALLLAPQSVMQSLHYQTNRHLEIESLWATPPLLLHLVTGFPLQVTFRERSYGILGPGTAFGDAGTPALVLIVLMVYWRWRRARDDLGGRTAVILIGTSAITLASAIMSKVLSPQYLIWVMAPLALLPVRWPTPRPRFRWLFAGAVVAFLASLPLTRWIYPLHFGELVHLLLPSAVGVLAVRNMLLVLTLILLLAAFWEVSRRSPDVFRPIPNGRER